MTAVDQQQPPRRAPSAVGLAALLFVVPLLGACEKWPPHEEELRRNFEENRVALESLEAKISGTKYFRVSQTGIMGIPRFNDSDHVVADFHGVEFVESDLIENDPEWEQFFRQAGVFSVSKYEDRATFGFVGSLPDKSRSIWVEYVRSAVQRKNLKPCLPEHKNLACGLCVVDLDDQWFLEYWWTPEDVIPDRYEEVLSGQLSDEEYWQEIDAALLECRINGYRSIGYDVSDWQ